MPQENQFFHKALSQGEEEELARRYARLVQSCVRPYFLTGGDYDDLVQEGMIGLLKAIREYDPARSQNFEAFAALCIRRQVYDALRRRKGKGRVCLTVRPPRTRKHSFWQKSRHGRSRKRYPGCCLPLKRLCCDPIWKAALLRKLPKRSVARPRRWKTPSAVSGASWPNICNKGDSRIDSCSQ